ncbi:MAG: DsrE family protein [Pseudomonadota bacterium]
MASKIAALITAAITSSALVASAQPEGFHLGPVIEEYGLVAIVPDRDPLPADTEFKVSFDLYEPAAIGELNRSLVSGARFLNMRAEAGVPTENMKLAFVVHGKAVHDVSTDAHYGEDSGEANPNRDLIEKLMANGVEIYVCGQSARYHSVEASELLPGVHMSLSAMTAHALLQQDGYTLNPF